MRITVNSTTLAAQTGWVAKTLPTRPAIPVLAGMRLDIQPDQVTLIGTDYDTWASVSMDADTDDTGTWVLPGRTLAALAATLPPGRSVVLEQDGARVRIQCGSVRASLLTLPAEDFPALPDRPGPVGRVEADALAAAVTRVDTAASDDATLDLLTGIHLQLSQDGLVATASDRYRVARAAIDWEPALADDAGGPVEVLVPHQALTQAVRGLAGHVEIGLHIIPGADSATQLCLHDGDRRLDVGLISYDSYLPVDKLLDISGKVTGTVRVATADLTAALQRVRTLAARETPVLLVLGTGGHLEVATGGGEDAEGADTVEADYDGDQLTVAFAPAFLADLLATIRAERVRLDLTGPHTPALATPVNEDGEDRFWHMIMPIRQPATSTAVAA